MASSSPATNTSSPLPKMMRAVIQPDRSSHHLTMTQLPIPKPSDEDEELLVKVHATSPCAGELDWAKYFPELFVHKEHDVPGQDIVGTILSSSSLSSEEEEDEKNRKKKQQQQQQQQQKQKKFKPGDRVYARIEATRPGGAAEYVVAKVSELAHCPTAPSSYSSSADDNGRNHHHHHLSTAEAAATPLSALTAYQALFVHGGLDPNGLGVSLIEAEKDKEEEGDDDDDDDNSHKTNKTQAKEAAAAAAAAARNQNARKRVLVTAASGGVGTWVVQLARAAGCEVVVGVCGTGNVEMVNGLGATEVVDYRMQSLGAWAAGDGGGRGRGEGRRACDLVIDCVGGETLSQCWDVVEGREEKEEDGEGEGGEGEGVLISICSDPEQAAPHRRRQLTGDKNKTTRRRVRSKFFIVEPKGEDLEIITRLIEAGKCRPVIDSVFGFDDFAQAWEKVEAGHSRGKVIVMIGDDKDNQ